MTKSASREKNTLIIQLRLLMRSCPKVPEQSAPPTVGCLRKTEESSTMIISFSLHNSCSNKMCQVILTKPKQLYRLFWDWVIYSMELLEVYYTSLVIGGVDAEGLTVTFRFTTSMIDDILEDVPMIDTNRYT